MSLRQLLLTRRAARKAHMMRAGGLVMPLYEYQCEQCGYRFERLVSLREAARRSKCSKCGSKSVRKLVSVVASVSSKSDGASECPTCTTGTCEL